MSAGLWFWLLYVICLVFGLWAVWPNDRAQIRPLGGQLVIFILLGLLGWGVFGPPIR
jgi:hypothetical protein